MMASWVICENPLQGGFREMEFVLLDCSTPVCHKFIRLYPDGRVEIGEKHSEFKPEYRTEVVH